MDFSLAIILVITSLCTAMAALIIVSLLPVPGKRQAASPTDTDGPVLLFNGERLVDATPGGWQLLDQGPEGLGPWHRLGAILAARFPGSVAALAGLRETGQAEIADRAGNAILQAQLIGGITRIALRDKPGRPPEIDPQCLASLNAELDILRRVATTMPTPAWQQDSQGVVLWANRAYLGLVENTLPQGETLTWPLPLLFDTVHAGGMAEDLSPHRFSISGRGGQNHWFDCIAFPQPDAPLFFAIPSDATVQAEASLRNFVQTLSKTFADLPTGLAIFNRARQLVMFNPALTDLCHVDPEFLSSRPLLFSFFDQLRERQMMPEPKDYRSWRQKMAALEKAASDGVYQETWTLPSGQTWRVSGRPHPDGAVAFLFEDISAEMSLTRRFRVELELGQAVLDGLDDAVAVFSSAGILTLSNTAYVSLWNSDPTRMLGDMDIRDAARLWADQCGASENWARIERFINRSGPREPWQADIKMADGTSLACRVRPIAGGATMVLFTAAPQDATAPALVSVDIT